MDTSANMWTFGQISGHLIQYPDMPDQYLGTLTDIQTPRLIYQYLDQ